MAQLRLGRVYGFLEAGTIAGYWRQKDTQAAASLIENRYRLSKIRDVLLCQPAEPDRPRPAFVPRRLSTRRVTPTQCTATRVPASNYTTVSRATHDLQ
jgi:hypothetical protein